VQITTTTNPLRLEPEGWYTEEQLRIMGLDGDQLARARRSEGLKYRQIGRRRWYKGAWVLQWLEAEPT
jgi:hypothetical protein